MRKAEPYCVPADLSFFQNTTFDINFYTLPKGVIISYQALLKADR